MTTAEAVIVEQLVRAAWARNETLCLLLLGQIGQLHRASAAASGEKASEAK